MDLPFLQRTLQLADSVRGVCAPNPAVAAVVVRNGVILGEGVHLGPGTDHGEVAAVKAAKEPVAGATLYVSLEPCCHHGRTGPCTEFIREAGISRVVYGYQDPNPVVSGKGAARLREWGIACEFLETAEMSAFYESYRWWTETRLPWVTAKLALSLDGKIAGAGGNPVPITGPALARRTHEGRRRSDAILTTARTVLRDDPLLNVRLSPSPLGKTVYILDSWGELPSDARIWESAKEVVVFCGPGATTQSLRERGARVETVDGSGERLDLRAVLERIGADGRHDLWVEAGGTLLRSLLEGGWVKKGIFYVSPKWLGESAQPAFHGEFPLLTQADRVRWMSEGNEAVCEMEWF